MAARFRAVALGVCCLMLVVPAPARAQTRLVSGTAQPENGFAELADRLARNPEGDTFASQLFELIDMAGELGQIEHVSAVLLPFIRDGELLARAAKELGRIAMTVRDYELADTLFETAYDASGGSDLESLYTQAQALLQLGRLAAAEQRARTVIDEAEGEELGRRAHVLLARSMHLRGRHADAAEVLAAPDDPAEVDPETLLLHSSVLVAQSSSGIAPLEQLAQRFPESVAFRILTGGRVREASLPVTLLTGPRDALPAREAGRPSTTATLRTGAPRVTAIQVGSFSNRDNAVHLAADLRKLGFDARSESVDRDGRRFDLVLVAVPGGSSDDAAATLSALRAAGYDGFRIY